MPNRLNLFLDASGDSRAKITSNASGVLTFDSANKDDAKIPHVMNVLGEANFKNFEDPSGNGHSQIDENGLTVQDASGKVMCQVDHKEIGFTDSNTSLSAHLTNHDLYIADDLGNYNQSTFSETIIQSSDSSGHFDASGFKVDDGSHSASLAAGSVVLADTSGSIEINVEDGSTAKMCFKDTEGNDLTVGKLSVDGAIMDTELRGKQLTNMYGDSTKDGQHPSVDDLVDLGGYLGYVGNVPPAQFPLEMKSVTITSLLDLIVRLQMKLKANDAKTAEIEANLNATDAKAATNATEIASLQTTVQNYPTAP